MTDQELIAGLRDPAGERTSGAGTYLALGRAAADRIEALNALLAEAFKLGNDMATATDAVVLSLERLKADNLKLIAENTTMRETLQCAWEQWGDDYLWKKWDLGKWE